MFHTPFVMQNLIGGNWDDDWSPALDQPKTRLHLYGKAESRPGRKMGHVTTLIPRGLRS
jgi:5-(carboxyamino)imidazole ribonucleotide synthase